MKIVKIALGIIVLLIVIGTVVKQMGTAKANAKVDEANAASTKADEHLQAAAKKYDELFSEANIAAFPGNREQLKKLAEEIVDHAKQGAKHFSDASSKFVEASKEQVGEDVVIEYWKLKGQTNQKLAEGTQALADGAALFLDATIADAAALQEKAMDCTNRLTKGMEEGKKLSADAEKIRTDNKDKFKQD